MKKERVLAAVSHKDTEVIPYNIELTSPMADKLCAVVGITPDGLWDWFGNHIEKIGYNRGRDIGGEVFEDEYGVQWDRSGIDKDIGMIKAFEAPGAGDGRVQAAGTGSYLCGNCHREVMGEGAGRP